MDLQSLAKLAKQNPNAAKAFLNKKKVGDVPREIKQQDKVFTQSQLDTLVTALVQKEVAKIPKPKDGETPTKAELQKIIEPLMPVIRQPKDGKDGEVTEKHIDDITNRILKQVGKTPDLTKAIVDVFKDEKIQAEDLPGFSELKERVEKLAKNQKYLGGKGIASGYTDSDVIRVANANGGFGGSSPLTTKGDLYTYDTDDARLPIGSNGQVLTADSAEATGMKWASVAGTGDVVGPASATNENIAVFDGTTGKLIKDGAVNISDVTANTTARHDAVTVTDTTTINHTLTGQDLQSEVIDNSITFAKMQDIATDRILGRTTAGTGNPESLTGSQVRDILNLATSDSPQFAGINLGHATDTTITRVSAGVIAVEGTNVSLEGHTHTASDVTDFDTEVSNNTDVAANTAARHAAVTVTDSAEIDFTLTGQDITASLVAGSIDETKLDTSVNTSLDLADSALQAADVDDTPVDGATTDPISSNWAFDHAADVDAHDAGINAQTGTTYTLVLGDIRKNVTMTNAAANTLTVPPNSSVAFPVGTKILITQSGAGATTIAAGSGVTINAPSTVTLAIDEQHESRAIIKTATDTWTLL